MSVDTITPLRSYLTSSILHFLSLSLILLHDVMPSSCAFNLPNSGQILSVALVREHRKKQAELAKQDSAPQHPCNVLPCSRLRLSSLRHSQPSTIISKLLRTDVTLVIPSIFLFPSSLCPKIPFATHNASTNVHRSMKRRTSAVELVGRRSAGRGWRGRKFEFVTKALSCLDKSRREDREGEFGAFNGGLCCLETGFPNEAFIGKRSTRGGRREPQTLVRNP